MKRFTQKFFLLAIGLILSVGAYAQGEGTPVVYHRFPEVQFTYTSGGTTRELTMPAWDIQFGGTGQGFVRVQRIAKTGDAKYTARIVTRLPLYNNGGSVEYHLVNKTDKIVYKGQEYTLSEFTYDKIIPDGYESLLAYQQALGGSDQEHWGTLSEDILKSFPVVHNVAIDGTSYNITGNYTIPKEIINASLGEHQIIEIGPFAYRNAQWDAPSTGWFKPTTITIPNEIKKIGRDGLSVNISNGYNATSEPYTKKITFEAGSTITEIPVEAFMSCVGLEEINIPASVISIGYGALGGCKLLKKIVFEGATPPSLGVSENGKYDFVTSSGSTYNIGRTKKDDPADHAKCIMEVPMGSALSYTQKDDLYKKFPMMSKLPITTESGMMSYCSELPFTFCPYNTSNKTWSSSDGSVKAYYVEEDKVSVANKNVDLTEITGTVKIPSTNFGVILTGEKDKKYDVYYPNNLTSISALQLPTGVTNSLIGVVEDKYIEIEEDCAYFVLSGGKFHPVTQNGTIKKNRAYLMIAAQEVMDYGSAPALTVSLPEETGIATHEVKNAQNDAWYTLQGVQVNQPSKGVFIKNGKKYIIK